MRIAGLRLDIALDELYKGFGKENLQIHLPKLIEALRQGNCPQPFEMECNRGGSFIDNEDMGSQSWFVLYFGSGKSQLYFNFTRNAMNSHVKKISPWKNPWRFLVFGIATNFTQDQKAQGAIEEYINSVDLRKSLGYQS